jgi:hypothetical protein
LSDSGEARTAIDEASTSTTHSRARTAREAKPKGARAKVGKPSLDRDLDLHPKGKSSLVDFIHEKKPTTQNEKNVVFVYYLQREAGLSSVNVDQVYTCYKEAKERVPSNLRNSLAVTSSRKGWINSDDMEDLSITPRGENVVDHDLPRQDKSGK